MPDDKLWVIIGRAVDDSAWPVCWRATSKEANETCLILNNQVLELVNWAESSTRRAIRWTEPARWQTMVESKKLEILDKNHPIHGDETDSKVWYVDYSVWGVSEDPSL